MTEIELKFQVPVERRVALRRAVATAKAQTLRLQAKYFDTPDRRLAAAHVTLRLRQEGQDWVQTLKCPGANRWSRLEHEVPRAPEPGEPALDLALHAGTPAGDLLAAALGDQADKLQVYYETDVQRTLRLVRSPGGQAEVALDIGEIRAGSERRELYEIEFELKDGTVAGLVALATRWSERHGLWLDVVSKAERGQGLAQGAQCIPPQHGRELVLKNPQSPDDALRQMVGACLAHLLPNAAEVAGAVAEPEHVHQTRVALRRLRTALRIYGDWSPEVDAGWIPGLKALFGQLGAVRDRDALEGELMPALREAGSPLADLPDDTEGTAVAEALRAPSTTCLWLALIAFSNGAPQKAESGQTPEAGLRALAVTKLKHLQRQLAKDAKAYASFDDARRHRTRRRLKRLRYGIEFASSLFRPKKVKTYLEQLKPAQDALGRYNDLVVAEQLFTRLLAQQPQAWFALGWLAARRADLLQTSRRQLKKWAKAPVFW